MSHKPKDIWYQVDGREVNYVEQPAGGQYIQLCRVIKQEENLQAPPSTLILKAKKVDESEYTTLNAVLFRDECSNDFNRLVSKFKIKQSNPIKVTVPGMSLFLFCLLLIFLCHCRIETQQIHSFIHL